MLIPLLYYFFIEKKSDKKDIIRFVSLNDFKLIFILFAKVIIV